MTHKPRFGLLNSYAARPQLNQHII